MIREIFAFIERFRMAIHVYLLRCFLDSLKQIMYSCVSNVHLTDGFPDTHGWIILCFFKLYKKNRISRTGHAHFCSGWDFQLTIIKNI